MSKFLSTLSLRRATHLFASSGVDFSISIHALLAESDQRVKMDSYLEFIISIHALLAESDTSSSLPKREIMYFYPRSPCGERPPSGFTSLSCKGDFYPRSPCGERQRNFASNAAAIRISIHALLAESDGVCIGSRTVIMEDFYPRSPCGERQLEWANYSRSA